jgi:Nucleotide modification associated domain 1
MMFKRGDKVRVIKDTKLRGKFIGQEGVVERIKTDGIRKLYVVNFNNNESRWFLDNELELIKNNQTNDKSHVKTVFNLSNIESHKKILNEIHDIYKRKNADYGNSFSEQFNEYGLLSAVIRLDDKMRRLKQLIKHEAQVKDESMEDTILDLASYAILTLMELRKNEGIE